MNLTEAQCMALLRLAHESADLADDDECATLKGLTVSGLVEWRPTPKVTDAGIAALRAWLT